MVGRLCSVLAANDAPDLGVGESETWVGYEKQYSEGYNLKFGTLTIVDELDEFSLNVWNFHNFSYLWLSWNLE